MAKFKEILSIQAEIELEDAFYFYSLKSYCIQSFYYIQNPIHYKFAFFNEFFIRRHFLAL